jgi:hypothetical protein
MAPCVRANINDTVCANMRAARIVVRTRPNRRRLAVASAASIRQPVWHGVFIAQPAGRADPGYHVWSFVQDRGRLLYGRRDVGAARRRDDLLGASSALAGPGGRTQTSPEMPMVVVLELREPGARRDPDTTSFRNNRLPGSLWNDAGASVSNRRPGRCRSNTTNPNDRSSLVCKKRCEPVNRCAVCERI